MSEFGRASLLPNSDISEHPVCVELFLAAFRAPGEMSVQRARHYPSGFLSVGEATLSGWRVGMQYCMSRV
ncbi:hypothetical protein Stsp01_66890 [Streptomyces sp. NBRC 13847]|nr:hypothetical protein Stsp01_66890 [Streptomyces sp. NBRC 13847]